MIKAGLIPGCKPNSDEGALVYNEPSVQVLGMRDATDNKQIRFKYTNDTIYIGVSHSYTKQGGTLVSNVLTSNNTLFQP